MKIMDQRDKESIKPYVLVGDVVKFITTDGREFLLAAVPSRHILTCAGCVLCGTADCDIYSQYKERPLCYTGKDAPLYCAFKFVDDILEDL